MNTQKPRRFLGTSTPTAQNVPGADTHGEFAAGELDEDVVRAWARACLHSALGPDRGEKQLEQAPYRLTLMTFLDVWEAAAEA